MDKGGFDIIGDLHGRGDELDALLGVMGYRIYRGAYWHPCRQALFVGDYLDRGPLIPYVVETVKRMQENGSAIALQANHEYNNYVPDIIYPGSALEDLPQRHQRSSEHRRFTAQQYAALNDGGALWMSHLKWIRSLPLFYETVEIRVAHAYWNPGHIALLKQRMPEGILSDDHVREVERNFLATPFSRAVLETLKGPKIPIEPFYAHGLMPDMFKGNATRGRIAWWCENGDDMTIAACDLFPELDPAITTALPLAQAGEMFVPDTDSRPVFFGHYSLTVAPARTAMHSQCVDFGVIRPQGYSTAYRWDEGDTELKHERLVSVPGLSP